MTYIKYLTIFAVITLCSCTWFQRNPEKTSEIEKDIIDMIETIVEAPQVTPTPAKA